MRYHFYIFITILYFIFNGVYGTGEETVNKTVFTPTTEWQTVKKGTPIPKGLHVRHNFQTGITEAKLMEPEDATNDVTSANDETSKSVALHPDAKELEISENNDVKLQQDYDKIVKISPEKLKTELKKIKSSTAPFASKTKRAKLRSIDELKEEYEKMNFDKTTDLDLLRIFIEQFNTHKDAINSGLLDPEEVKIIIEILGQLEYLVHDIDNGLEFAKAGGLVNVLYPCLNGTVEEIKSEALRVLGAAIQSNPKVKETALELEFVQKILRVLAKYSNAKLMDRSIYALGSLVRLYPTAQKVFIRHGGLEIFSQLLIEGQISTQKRVINLIYDLIIEREELNKIDDLKIRDLKIKEYSDVKLEEKIIEHKLCKQLGNLLINTIQHGLENEFNTDDRDLLEAIYECSITIGNICKFQFNQNHNEILSALNKISAFYNNSDQNLNSDDNYHQNMLTLVKQIKKTIFEKTHDEL